MNLESVFSIIGFVEKRKAARYLLILLNVALLITLTNYCYVLTIGDYSFAAIESKAEVLNYFVRGNFLIPFILFVMVWLATELLGTWIVNSFASWILKLTMPLKREMIEKDSFMNIGWLRSLTEKLSQDTVTRNAAWNQPPLIIEMQCALSQKFIRDALMTSIRFMICVIIAAFVVKEFPIWLLLLTAVAVYIAFHAGRLFYLTLEMLPFFITQYQEAANRIKEEGKTRQ